MFDFLGAFGTVIPGYQQGQQQAVTDNWKDLANYNQVQSGQLQNIFDEQAMLPRVNIMRDQAALSRMGVYNTGMDAQIKLAAFPGQLEAAGIRGNFAPVIARSATEAQLKLLDDLLKGGVTQAAPAYGLAVPSGAVPTYQGF